MSKKKLQKETDIETDVETYREHEYEIDSKLDDDEKLTLTKGSQNESEDLNETLKLPIGDVIQTLGINMSNKAPEIKRGIVEAIQRMMGDLNKFGVNVVLSENDDKGDLEDSDLFGDEEKDEREMNEDFDTIMEELETNDGPVVEIQENVNPRIKKRDLVNYLKNKKDAK